ncbi:MAG: HAD family hydrolase [Rhodoferax sp.]
MTDLSAPPAPTLAPAPLPLSAWPAQERRALVGVFTDIDDTLTTHGELTADARGALHALRQVGVRVVPITGRPLGWCAPFLAADNPQRWPVDAIVAENGAAAWVLPHLWKEIGTQPAWNKGSLLQKLYQLDAPTRAAQYQRLQAVAAQVEAALPGVRRSRDSDGRETDIAFDYAEFDQHPPETVQAVLALLRAQGLHTAVSSIHIHGCVQAFDKWSGACWIVRTLLQRELGAELERWAFVGDSGNDQPMFAHFAHSVGVANIAAVLPTLTHRPRYLCRGARGAGFAELAQAIVEAR